jgi:hypothetical protein
VARVPGETETEGIAERVSGMKSEEEKIDSLLRRNAAEQLAGVNWDELKGAISGRLDKAQQGKTSATGLPTVFKIAASFAAAAAVVFIIVIVGSINGRGSATVAIINPSDRVQVQVNIAGKDSSQGRGDVRIIESSTAQKQEGQTRPSWFLISMAEPASTINGADRDMKDVICLF